jgi:hypothetical protein
VTDKKHILRWLACFVAALIPADVAAQSRDRYAVFFSSQPTEIPSGLVVLKVLAPAKVDWSTGFAEVAILEPVDGVRGLDRIEVKIDPSGNVCDFGCDGSSYTIGAVDGPAYILGKFERSDGGSVYFHAYWWPRKWPDFRKGKKPEDYIVDPAYLPKPVKQ